MKKYLFPLSKRSIALITVGIVLNLMGRSITSFYEVPFFMDSYGTFLVAILLGPLGGAVTGLLSNVLLGFLITSKWLYGLVNAGGGLVVGSFLYHKERVNSFTVIGTSVFTALVMATLSTPLNLIFHGGMSGNIWGDALVELMSKYVGVRWLCSLSGELIVDLPDKSLCLILLMTLIYLMRRNGIHMIPEEETGRPDREQDLSQERAQEQKQAEETKETEQVENTKKEDGTRIGVSGLLLAAVLGGLLLSLILQTPARAESLTDLSTPDFSADYASMLFGINEGLTTLEINAITQSGDGYIWVGAYSGLYRYDGTRFEQIVLDSRISSCVVLFTDRKGRIWIGTNDSGVGCYDPYTNELAFFSTDDGLSANTIRDICEDEDGHIYVGTTAQLCRISLMSRQEVEAAAHLTEEEDGEDAEEEDGEDAPLPAEILVYDDLTELVDCYSLVGIDDDRIAGVTRDGLLFVMREGVILNTATSGNLESKFTAVGYGGKGYFLVGYDSAQMEILHLSSAGFVETSTLNTRGLADFTDITYITDVNGYFVATQNGFGFVRKDGKMQNLSRDSFHVAITDILRDKQGNIWFTSSKQGILKLSRNPFSDLFEQLGVAAAPVNTILIDDWQGYVGTDSGVIKVNMELNMTVPDKSLEILDGVRVRHIMEDSKGYLWFSTYGTVGLVRISPDKEIETFNEENSRILGNRFRFTMELSDGSILISSTSGLTLMKDNNILWTMDEKAGLDVPKILSAVEDDEGTLWLGSDGGGVYKVRKGRMVRHYGREDGLLSDVVMKVVPCDGGRVYVASNGLYYHKDGEEEIHKLEYFPYTNNYDIYFSGDGRSFISSSAGLYVVQTSELLEDDHEYAYSLLNQNRGLSMSLMANSFCATSGDEIYLCCTEGVMVLNTEDYQNFDSHYQIVLKSLTCDNETIPYENGVYNLPAGPGVMIFYPSILNYSVSDPLVLVELEGIDTEPVITRQSTLSEFYYPEIPYGDHRLKIQVLDDSGFKVLKEMIFLIHKDSKLYERRYYRVYLIANLALILTFIVWMVAKMGNMAVINRQYDQIREAKEDAEYANQAKSRFLAQMSHEIRPPINAVLGMDEMILRESREPEIRGYAYDIYNAGNTLLSLINDILDSSKIESGKMEIVPAEYEPAALVRDLLNMITPRAQAKDLRLEVEVDPNLPTTLFGDDVRIRQIITNILTNAVKYTTSGTVWLRVSGKRKTDKWMLHVEIEDTGIGIKEEDLPKLFEEYQRIEEGRNRRIEGTGLGMNITIQLLHMMDSKLEVNSIYGKGSKFYFDLPQTIINGSPIGAFDRTVRVKDSFGIDEEAFTAPDAKVLVVDDNEMNRKVFRSLLKLTGIQVSEAASGEESLTKVSFDHYDIIFMDHMMPGMDGIEAMKRIREREDCRDIPIYALTANAITGAREHYLSLGFNGFLSKPISVEKLNEAIRASLPEEMLHPMTEEEKQQLLASGQKNNNNPVPEDLPDVEGLDWNYAWLHLPNRDMLRDAVDAFYEILPLQADRLQAMYEQMLPKVGNVSAVSKTAGDGDQEETPLDAYRIQVHGMKSAAATIGIVPLAGMAKVLEFAAREGNMKRIHSLHETFISEWRSYEDKLRGVFGLGVQVPSGEGGAEREQGDPELLRAMIDLLRPALEDLDVDSTDEIVQRMKNTSFGPEIDALVPPLSAAVRDLDEELAGKYMNEMLRLIGAP